MNLLGSSAKWFSRQPLKNRLMLLLTPVVMLTLLAVGLFSYHRTAAIVLEQKIGLIQNLNEKTETGVKNILERAMETTETVLYFPSVYESLLGVKSNAPSAQMTDYKSMEEYFWALEKQFGFAGLRLYVSNASLMYQNPSAHFYPFSRLTKDIPVATTITSRADQVSIVDTYRRENVDQSSVKRIGVVRLLVNAPNKTVTAAIAVELNPQTLLEGWDHEPFGNMETALVSADGVVISSTNPQDILSTIDMSLMDDLKRGAVFMQGGLYYVAQAVSRTGWMLVRSVPASELTAAIRPILVTTVLLILIACGLTAPAMFMVASSVTHKLRELTQRIQSDTGVETLRDISRERLDAQEKSQDETDVLMLTYNRLLERIRLLTQENELAIRRESDARYEALQMQINPHFLYNTLSSIQGYIEINERSTAEGMLMQLSDLFGHTLGRGDHIVPLREELDTIESYLKVQQMVYPNQFDYKIEAPKALLDLRLPRFLLQPVVENALVHGAREAKGTGYILVAGERMEREVRLWVEDNGPGFSAAFLDEQTAHNASGHGIGLSNVMLRLKMHFGEGAQMRFENRTGSPADGARVVLVIPIRPGAQPEAAEGAEA